MLHDRTYIIILFLYIRYKKIEKATNLGIGAYGVGSLLVIFLCIVSPFIVVLPSNHSVYKCLDTEKNTYVAMKRIKLEVEDEGIPTTGIHSL